jgi:hypothetical protein
MTSISWANAYLASRPDVVARLSANQIEDIVGVIAAAYDETVRLERSRCVGHLELGRACGDLGLAEKAILDGSSVESMSRRYIDTADQRGGLHAATTRHALSPEVSS